jgi:hypothetical protein
LVDHGQEEYKVDREDAVCVVVDSVVGWLVQQELRLRRVVLVVGAFFDKTCVVRLMTAWMTLWGHAGMNEGEIMNEILPFVEVVP